MTSYIHTNTCMLIYSCIHFYRFPKMDGAGGYSGNLEEGTGGAQRNPQHQASQKRLQQTQAKVDEVHFMPLI